MTSVLIENIGQLVTNRLDPMCLVDDAADEEPWNLGLIEDAAVVVEDGTVVFVGHRGDETQADRRIDLRGRTLIPGFVDSHTHLMFAGQRSEEFRSRLMGEPYTGGGIMNTVRATRAASDDELRRNTANLMAEMRAQGTTWCEIKSGYGLSVQDERRLCRIAAEFTDDVTFLGAHALPAEYASHDDYVDLVRGPMLEACAPYIRWVDVFCEPHSPVAFDEEQTRVVLEAASELGIPSRLHGAQLGYGPAVRLACEFSSASVDHCTFLSREDVDLLAQAHDVGSGGSGPVPTFLPAVEFLTRQPYPDARPVIDAGIPVAIASDCNPGSCFSSSIPFAITLAVREMGFTPEEALWAATAGAARALRRRDIGVIARGCQARFAVVDAPGYLYLTYRAGVPLCRALEFEESVEA